MKSCHPDLCPGMARLLYAFSFDGYELCGNQWNEPHDIDPAHVFANKKTAEKYRSLLPKAMKHLKYKVIFISNSNPDSPDSLPELFKRENGGQTVSN